MSSHISVPSVLITNLLKSSMCNCFWTSQSNGLPGGGGGAGVLSRPAESVLLFLYHVCQLRRHWSLRSYVNGYNGQPVGIIIVLP